MHTGSCLCRAVRFEIDGPLEPIQLCHCADCRKAQGSAFGANIPVAVASLRFVEGQDQLKAYSHTPGKERVFCAACGSPIFSRRPAAPTTVRIRAGTLDAPVNAPLAFHFFTDDRADWIELPNDGLPRHPGAWPL